MKKSAIEMIPIEYPLFSCYIHYFICANRKKVQSYLENKYPKFRFDVPSDQAGGGCFKREGYDPIVWLSNKKPYIVVHEMIHAVSDLFEGIGLKINKETEEVFAYMVDYAVRQVLK